MTLREKTWLRFDTQTYIEGTARGPAGGTYRRIEPSEAFIDANEVVGVVQTGPGLCTIFLRGGLSVAHVLSPVKRAVERIFAAATGEASAP